MKEELVKSDVIFNEEEHSYHRGDQPFGGVTSIVKWVYPETYKGIPQSVLQKAADHGSLIHKACQLYNEAGISDDKEQQVRDYVKLMWENRLDPVASEYTVSDDMHIASQIDVVYRGETGYFLADIKTTSEIHVPNVTLQLSIYAWLFEKQNEGKKVDRLAVVWLPRPQYGVAKLMDLKRIPSELCEKIVTSYVNGEDGTMWAGVIAEALGESEEVKEPALIEEALPTTLTDAEKEIVKIETTVKQMQDRSKELRAGLLKLMQDHGVKKWSGELVEFTRKAPSVRKTVDSAKLKKMYPDIFYAVQKESKVNESLMIKIK